MKTNAQLLAPPLSGDGHSMLAKVEPPLLFRLILHLVLRHPWNPKQGWKNTWVSEWQIAVIEVNLDVARLCDDARRHGMPIRIHRCAYKRASYVVCCEAFIEKVVYVDEKAYVHLRDARELQVRPSKGATPGQNVYYAAVEVEDLRLG